MGPWLPLTLVSTCLFSLHPLLLSPRLLASFLFFLCPSFPPPPFLTTPFFTPCWFLGGPGEDLERNDGSQERPYFMSPEMRDIFLKGSPQEGKQEEVEEE